MLFFIQQPNEFKLYFAPISNNQALENSNSSSAVEAVIAQHDFEGLSLAATVQQQQHLSDYSSAVVADIARHDFEGFL